MHTITKAQERITHKKVDQQMRSKKESTLLTQEAIRSPR